jgi:hypothetical protein
MQRAMRTMLLDERPASRDVQRTPRISLMESALGPRMELTLTRPPVLGVIDGKAMDPFDIHAPTIGAMELREVPRPPRPPHLAGVEDTSPREVELWWVPYDPATKAPEARADGTPKGVRVAGRIAKMDVMLVKTSEDKKLEKRSSGEVVDWASVPAFVELNLEMIDGQRGSWMLEVAAQTGKAPGAAAAADSDLPVALLDRLREDLAAGENPTTPPTEDNTGGQNGNNNGNSGNGNNGSGNGNGNTRDPAEEARRLEEALARLMELLNSLNGGGGG